MCFQACDLLAVADAYQEKRLMFSVEGQQLRTKYMK